jgi:hypothetical protein
MCDVVAQLVERPERQVATLPDSALGRLAMKTRQFARVCCGQPSASPASASVPSLPPPPASGLRHVRPHAVGLRVLTEHVLA